MKIHGPRTATFLALVIIGMAISAAAGTQLSRAQGDAMARKIEAIAKNGAANPVRPKRTPMSELEINSYMNFNLRDKIPRGLAGPQISLLGNGRLSGRVFVDIDEFKRHRASAGFLDPLNYLSGQVPVTASGTLSTRSGQGRFQFYAADILGVPLPKPILQELVSFFSRTPDRPNGFNMDEPFDLPAKIREVAVDSGETIVAQ
ncbi:MAG TPA: hypothetical protein VKR81_01590 [Candidatus Binatia bacterium]|nr:hypothetical protein [Candidatus Binatia bacterium]